MDGRARPLLTPPGHRATGRRSSHRTGPVDAARPPNHRQAGAGHRGMYFHHSHANSCRLSFQGAALEAPGEQRPAVCTRTAGGRWDGRQGEALFALVFVNVHDPPGTIREGRQGVGKGRRNKRKMIEFNLII